MLAIFKHSYCSSLESEGGQATEGRASNALASTAVGLKQAAAQHGGKNLVSRGKEY